MTNIGERKRLRKWLETMGWGSPRRDQHTIHDVLLVRTGGAEPYGLIGLIASLLVIPLASALIAAMLAAMILAAQVASMGVDETRSYYLSLRFDFALQTKLYALAVTGLYLSLAAATLGLAYHKARGAWADLVAFRRVGEGRRNTSVAILVLIYAVLASLALASLRERRPPLDGPTDTILLALLAANYVIFAPIAEEIFFRGWLYTGLRRRFGFGATLFITALTFAAFHWEPRHMVLVLPLAFALGFIREQTASIRPTIALHASYNMVIVAIALLME